MNHKLAFLAAGLALLAMPLLGVSAEAKHRTRHSHQAQHYAYYYQQARSIDGALVDGDGWRQVHSWDNGCFNLRYLHSMFACSPNS
jgi:hypothetical protein